MLAYLDTLIGFAVVMLGISLLIMILTQMASSLLSHRGANLKWGLVTLFQHIPDCPVMNIPAHAEKLAEEVLSHPLISDSIFSMKLPLPIPKWLADRMKLATAINPNELVAILQDISTHNLVAKFKSDSVMGLSAEIAELIAETNPVANRRLSLLGGVEAFKELEIAQEVPLFKDALNEFQGEAGKLEAWFNATMERVSARFTTYVRLWTVGFAITVALVTGLNTVTLLSVLYSNGDFREQVVGSAPQMLNLAGKISPDISKDDATAMYTGLLVKALNDSNITADTTPEGIDSESAASDWIGKHVIDPTQQTRAVKAFDTAFLNQRTQDAVAVRALLTKSSFDVLQFRWQSGKSVWIQLPGVLATAALLSLGAPFWFNVLKQLTNLRPMLAQKQDADSK